MRSPIPPCNGRLPVSANFISDRFPADRTYIRVQILRYYDYPGMSGRKFEARQLLKEKKFWVASFLIAWAAALQGHMMWLQRQETFKQKFGDANPERDSEKPAEELIQFDDCDCELK